MLTLFSYSFCVRKEQHWKLLKVLDQQLNKQKKVKVSVAVILDSLQLHGL